MRVTFLSPAIMEKGSFWSSYIPFMEVAAKSLGIRLDVMYATNRFEVEENARKALSGPVKPDYLVYIYQAQKTQDVLGMAEKAGVKSFIVNTDIIPNERYKVLYPRQKYVNWIGHMYPDDIQAGQLLAQALLDQAAVRKMAAPTGKYHVVGIGGSRDSTASSYREKGLLRAVVNDPAVVLDKYVLANWDPAVAGKKAASLLEIYPLANIYWSASDGMALSIADAMVEAGVTPGEDALIGGVDWSRQGIEAVRKGRMAATVGGHFIEGAWALTLLYDYHHGVDFGESEVVCRFRMGLIDKENVEAYLRLLDRGNWTKIDFTRFSKVLNPGLRKYDFSPDAIVRQLGR